VRPRPPDRGDSFWSIWSRRALSLPAHLGLAVLCVATAPVWVIAALATDAVTGKLRTLPRSRALAFFALYLGCELAGVAVAGLLWLFTGGGWLGGAERYRQANFSLQRVWANTLFHGALFLFSMKLEVEGAELAQRGPLLLFVRHSSTADTVLAAAIVASPHRLALRYVLKRELLWDPCLDIVGRRLPNAFIDRASRRSHGEVRAIAKLAQNLDPSSAVLIYPEGTRFSAQKLTAAVAALRARGNAACAEIAAGFQSVLPPRLGGPLALLEAAPGVDVVFVEHVGFEGAATFARFWSGALVHQTIHVRLRRVAAAEIPPHHRDRWLFEQWSETDRWISARTPRAGAAR